MCWDLPSTRAEMTLPGPIRGEYCGQLTNQRAVLFTQRWQREVDLGCLLQPRPRRLGLGLPLAPRQVHKVQLALEIFFIFTFPKYFLLFYNYFFLYNDMITFLMWPSPPESIISMLMVNMEWDLKYETLIEWSLAFFKYWESWLESGIPSDNRQWPGGVRVHLGGARGPVVPPLGHQRLALPSVGHRVQRDVLNI